MLKLISATPSPYARKVRIALAEKGIPFEEDAGIRPSQDPALLDRSPMGKVPFMEVDGARLCESAVILEYLEDAFPQKPLLPKDPLARAKARELGVVAIVGNWRLLDAAVFAQAHAQGWRVLSYTVNDPAEAERLQGLGIAGLITDAIDHLGPGSGR
mgnify:CR=1 FL=1